jgi:hypothetical protein
MSSGWEGSKREGHANLSIVLLSLGKLDSRSIGGFIPLTEQTRNEYE